MGDNVMNRHDEAFWNALDELVNIGCTEEEKSIVYETHNETQFMKGILIRR